MLFWVAVALGVSLIGSTLALILILRLYYRFGIKVKNAVREREFASVALRNL